LLNAIDEGALARARSFYFEPSSESFGFVSPIVRPRQPFPRIVRKGQFTVQNLPPMLEFVRQALIIS
jgi:hypothetical protein